MDQELTNAVSRWRAKADHDLSAAERLLSGSEPLTDAACFHCQQAVEKYLKLFLIAANRVPPKTHNLALVLGECVKIDPEFNRLSDTVYLTDYGVSVRYADDFYLPKTEEAEKALADARLVRNFVIQKLRL